MLFKEQGKQAIESSFFLDQVTLGSCPGRVVVDLFVAAETDRQTVFEIVEPLAAAPVDVMNLGR
jgi:hypothetical protein